jgi:hypothetical protein
MAYCNNDYWPLSKEINECQRAQKWREVIDRILLNPMAPDDDRLGKVNTARSNLGIQSLGLELMGDAAKE